MNAMPEMVTHRYDPEQGPCLNLCVLSDPDAERLLDHLRKSRPALRPDYLARRRTTEAWLAREASEALGRTIEQAPAYFFLGDFSHGPDSSRPAALVVPLANLPPHAITFTLGDSMKVVEESSARVYNLPEMVALFAEGAVAEFGLSDRHGIQTRFIEMQLWEPSRVSSQRVS